MEAEPSTARPTGTPSLQHFRDAGHTGGELHIGNGTVGHAGAGPGQLPQLLVVEVDAVGVPDIRACPPQRGHILQWPDAVVLQCVTLLVLCLTEMGVEPDAVLTGQQSALPQKFSADGEGRAGGQGDLMHRAGAGIVILLQDAAGILQDLIHGLHHAVRRQSPVLPGEVHAAPGGKHSDTQGFRGLRAGCRSDLRRLRERHSGGQSRWCSRT